MISLKNCLAQNGIIDKLKLQVFVKCGLDADFGEKNFCYNMKEWLTLTIEGKYFISVFFCA